MLLLTMISSTTLLVDSAQTHQVLHSCEERINVFVFSLLLRD